MSRFLTEGDRKGHACYCAAILRLERFMKLSVRDVGSVAIIDLDGNITIRRGDIMLRDMVTELLGNGRKQIVLNLAEVGYMDSGGIGEMVACS